MSPVCDRSFEMSTAHSPSVPRPTGSSISLPSHLSTAGGSAMHEAYACHHGRPRLVEGRYAAVRVATPPAADLPRGGKGCETRRAMDFDLSDDQVALQSGARELLDTLAS